MKELKVTTEYDNWHRKKIRTMLLDFLRDSLNAEMTEDTVSLGRLYAFTEKWVDEHFPFSFHDPECEVCQEIEKGDSCR